MPAYSLQEGFRQLLIANTGLAALVPAERITADFVPHSADEVGPWIELEQVSGNRAGSHDGDCGLRFARFQLNIGGNDREAVLAVHDYISENFESAEFSDTTQAGHSRKLVTFIADEGSVWDEDNRTFGARIDLEVQSDTN